MKQISASTLCYYCYSCNKLAEDEQFNGVMRCKYFMPAVEDWQEKQRKELKDGIHKSTKQDKERDTHVSVR